MKVRVQDGAKQKKFHHPLYHDASTTCDFGFVQPIMSREVSSKDTINLQIPQFVRLGIVKKPTFGRMSLRTYNYFVPMETVYHPYGSFLDQMPYCHGGESYIPSETTCAPMDLITTMLRFHSKVYVVKASGYGKTLSDEHYFNSATQCTKSVAQSKINYYFNMRISEYDMEGWDSIPELLSEAGLPYFGNFYTDVDESDFTTMPDLDTVDWIDSFQDASDDWYIIFGMYTRAGRNIRKILLGCGFQENNLYDNLSILPIFAYYKAYFDLFNPQRDITWKETYCYMLMEALDYAGTHRLDYALSAEIGDNTGITILAWWSFWLFELPACYYTCNPDFVSAHISGASLQSATEGDSINRDVSGIADDGGVGFLATVGQGGNEQYHGSGVNDNYSRVMARVVDILSKRLNTKTAVGGDIEAYVRSTYGASLQREERIDFIGSQVMDIVISDVMSTAETEEGALGQYAGKGIGALDAKAAKRFTFTTNETGFLVSMITIVPDASYCQGVDPLLQHKTLRDYFDSDLDGTFLVPTKKSAIYGCACMPGMKNQEFQTKSFGNIPVYSEYKRAQNVLNGDLSRRSTYASFQPYTLDKLLPFSHVLPPNLDSLDPLEHNFRFVNVRPDIIVNGTMWRYIGYFRWFGQYDRIFLQSGDTDNPRIMFQSVGNWLHDMGVDDNFIVHNFIDLSCEAFALPMADSFDTGSFDGPTLNVEKA